MVCSLVALFTGTLQCCSSVCDVHVVCSLILLSLILQRIRKFHDRSAFRNRTNELPENSNPALMLLRLPFSCIGNYVEMVCIFCFATVAIRFTLLLNTCVIWIHFYHRQWFLLNLISLNLSHLVHVSLMALFVHLTFSLYVCRHKSINHHHRYL